MGAVDNNGNKFGPLTCGSSGRVTIHFPREASASLFPIARPLLVSEGIPEFADKGKDTDYRAFVIAPPEYHRGCLRLLVAAGGRQVERKTGKGSFPLLRLSVCDMIFRDYKAYTHIRNPRVDSLPPSPFPRLLDIQNCRNRTNNSVRNTMDNASFSPLV